MKIIYVLEGQVHDDTLGIKLQDLSVGNFIEVEAKSQKPFPYGEFRIASITHKFGTYSKDNWGEPLVRVLLESN